MDADVLCFLKDAKLCPCDCSCGSLLICPGHRLETEEGQGNLVKEILRKISELLKAWESML